MTQLKTIRTAFRGWEGGGVRPLASVHPFTSQKLKEGKTVHFEVTEITEDHKTRNYVGKYKTIAEARKRAYSIVAKKKGNASEIFRWYLTEAYADSSRNPKKVETHHAYYHIETWMNEGSRILVEEY